MNCRHCHSELNYLFLDLGHAVPSNAYLSQSDLQKPELTFPLRLYVCDKCWLVQTDDHVSSSELFSSNYAYFSSISKSWVAHARCYSQNIISRLGLTSDDFVIEIASNDGYLLKNFVAAGIPCLGIEPTNSTADAAEKIGIPVLRKFFNSKTAEMLAKEGKRADLICGNNVYAHVPDINDFTEGLRTILNPGGTINLEFPHLMRFIQGNQFDTAYHEHFSYLSLSAVTRIFSRSGLRVFNVEELPTHGGSLRVYGCHEGDPRPTAASVHDLLLSEKSFGMLDINGYLKFQGKVDAIKNDFLSFLIEKKRAGQTVAAYGAAAKGNTLMNYAGVKPDLIQFVCDAAPSKQGKYMPQSHLPILPPSELIAAKPEWVVIFPWNIAEEIRLEHSYIQNWGGRFVVAIPQLRVLA